MLRFTARLPLAAIGLAVALLSGCTDGSGDPDGADPSASIDTSPKAFEEYSGVTLPDDAEDPAIRAENGETGDPVYTLHYTGAPAGAEDVCTQVGNWLVHPDGVSKDERKRFGIDPADVKSAGDEVRGCEAVMQDKGVQVEGIVLYPDPDTADVYLRAYKLGR